MREAASRAGLMQVCFSSQVALLATEPLRARTRWLFSFRMISDTRLECQDASEARQTGPFWAIEEAGSGVKPGGAGTALLDGFLSRH